MKYYNFFKFKLIYILMLIFIFLSVSHIFFATAIARGLAMDGSLWMPKILNDISSTGWGFEPVLWRTRCFINIINQLPLNIAYHLGVHSKMALCRWFSLPLFLFPFIVTLWNTYLAKRTKRYDIALLGLFVYSVLILPAIMYAVVEFYLACTLIILYFHYLVSKIKFTKTDIFIILLTSIILLYASEFMVFIGPMFCIYILSVTIRENKSKEKLIKCLMGVFSVITAIVQIFFNYLLIINHTIISNDVLPEINSLFYFLFNWKSYFIYPYIIETVFFFLIIAALIYRKKIKLCGIISIFIVFGLTLFYMMNYKYFQLYSFVYAIYRFYIYILFPIIFFFIVSMDIFKKYLSKQKIYNLFILILITGIINTSLQLIYSAQVFKLQETFQYILKNSEKTFLIADEYFKNIYGNINNNFFLPMSVSSDSIIYADDYKINKFILTDPSRTKNRLFEEISFYPEKNIVLAYFYKLNIKNKFWDLSNIADEFNQNPYYIETYKIKYMGQIHK